METEHAASLDGLFPTEEQHHEGTTYKHVIYELPSPIQGRTHLDLRLVGKHTLWGDHLWNGGRWISYHIIQNEHLVRGKRVLELGAGAGTPSLVAGLLGASMVP